MPGTGSTQVPLAPVRVVSPLRLRVRGGRADEKGCRGEPEFHCSNTSQATSRQLPLSLVHSAAITPPRLLPTLKRNTEPE